MTTRILFVCLGNICRSPSAEGVFRALAPGHPVDSAGTSAIHAGARPHPPMQRAAKAKGVDLSGLRARGLVAADFDRFDLILGMDRHNLTDIEMLRPPGNTTPARLFTDFAPGAGDGVPDPYYSGDYTGALDLIEVGCAGLIAHLGAADPASD